MSAGKIGGRVDSLVIEHATRSALINGDRLELSPIDFALLSMLASRPGEVVPHKDLSEEAFGSAMAPHDLHWRIWRLRRITGDLKREEKMLENRRGQGYVLKISDDAVTIVHRLEMDDEVEPLPTVPVEEEPTEEAPVAEVVVDLTEETAALEAVTPLGPPSIAEPKATRRRYIRPKAVLVASAVAAATLASSWSAGYLLAGGRGSEDRSSEVSQLESQAPADPPEPPGDSKDRDRKKKAADSRDKNRTAKRRTDRGAGGKGTTVLAAPPSSSGNTGGTAPAPAEPKPDKNTSNNGGSQTAPALPAAPTRYLYHLVHPETGDHFVTTDSNTASEHQAKGYQGSAIARVYTSQESGTRALTTNHGTAWIFIGSSPRTEPASQPVPLWYSTNNAGDFFYTTSESEAKASGWSASLAGYARAL